MVRSLCAAIVGGILVAGCGSLQPSLTERDRYVVNTPQYPDNRVFYFKNGDAGETVALESSLQVDKAKDYPIHGDPITVVVNSVSLPYVLEDTEKTRDIAVILDVNTSADTNQEPLVVWYQRAVRGGQALNFANLVIYSSHAWDDRYAPYFRIRVMEVAAEANLETREALAEVQKYGTGIAALAQNPLATSIVSVATKAASLMLASKQNQMILDYTAQFYGRQYIATGNNPSLTPLKIGRYALLGRSRSDLKEVEFWKNREFSYSELGYFALEKKGGVASNFVPMASPVVVMSVFNREMTVPTEVSAKSAYLTQLIVKATSSNFDSIKTTSDDLHKSINAYVAQQKVYKYRTKADLYSVITLISSSDYSSETKADMNRFLRTITGCVNFSENDWADWSANYLSDISFLSTEDQKRPGQLLDMDASKCKTKS